MLLFKVNKLKLTRVDEEFVVNKTENYFKAQFEFLSSDWQDKAVVAFFENEGGVGYEIALENNECIIPLEVLKDGIFKVGLYAVKSPVLMRTNFVRVRLENGCGINGETPSEPTPTIYEQILQKCEKAVATATDVQNRADNGEFNGKDYILTDADKTEIATTVKNEYFAELETLIDESGVLSE